MIMISIPVFVRASGLMSSIKRTEGIQPAGTTAKSKEDTSKKEQTPRRQNKKHMRSTDQDIPARSFASVLGNLIDLRG